MDPITASIIVGGLSGLFGGMGQASQAKKDRRESARQFDLQYGLSKNADTRAQGEYDLQMGSTRATTPARLSILKALMQRFGLPGGDIQAPSLAPSAPLPTPAPPKIQTGLTAGFAPIVDAMSDPVKRQQIERIHARLKEGF